MITVKQFLVLGLGGVSTAFAYSLIRFSSWRLIFYTCLASATITAFAFLALSIFVVVPLDLEDKRTFKRRTRLAFSRSSNWESERQKAESLAEYTPEKLVPNEPELSDEIDNILAVILSKFVKSWYASISASPVFLNKVDSTLRSVLSALIDRISAENTVDVVSLQILPLLTEHLREFEKAEKAVRGKKLNRPVTESEELDAVIAAKYRQGNLHPAASLSLSLSKSSEQDYLRKLSFQLLRKLLPKSAQTSNVVNSLLREIVGCSVLFPVVQMLVDPDMWNRVLESQSRKVIEERKAVRRVRDALQEYATPTKDGIQPAAAPSATLPRISPHDNERNFERFIRAIQRCNNLSDARRFRCEVASQLHRERSTACPEGMYIRRLQMGKQMLDQRISLLGAGTVRKPSRSVKRGKFKVSSLDKSVSPLLSLWGGNQTESNYSSDRPSEDVTLREILTNSSSLSTFTEFMDRQGQMSLVQFWLVADSFRAPVAEPKDDNSPFPAQETSWTDADRTDLARVKEVYLGQPEIGATPEQIRTINVFLRAGKRASGAQYGAAKEALFQVQEAVFEEMEEVAFSSFKESDLWFKLLASGSVVKRKAPPPPIIPPSFVKSLSAPSGKENVGDNSRILDAMQAALSGIVAETESENRPPLASLGLGLENSQTLDFENKPAELERGPYVGPEGSDDDSSSKSTIHPVAPGDLGLVEAIDSLTLEIEGLVNQKEIAVLLLAKARESNNATEERILAKSKLSLERELEAKEKQRQQYILQESDNGLHGRSRITIESIVSALDSEKREYSLYIVKVHRQAGEMPAAVWAVSRRYSEFNTLHRRLRIKYPEVAQVSFPGRQLMLTLQSQQELLEKRRAGLERYLQTLLTIPAVCQSQEFRFFLSRPLQSLSRSSNSSSSASFSINLINRIYSSVADGVGLLGSLPVLDQLSASGQSMLASRSPVPSSPALSSISHGGTERSSPVIEGQAGLQTLDRQEGPGPPLVESVLQFFVELFELDRDANWLRGRAMLVFQQLLGGTVERRIRSIFSDFLSPAALAESLRDARKRLWPSEPAPPPTPAPPRTEEEKKRTKIEAMALVPLLFADSVGSVVGRSNAGQGGRRLVAALNNRVLNVHLVFSIIDELVRVYKLGEPEEQLIT